MTQRRKLIEVALPLEAINREAAREKSIRHGHPSTLHLWWARRPLAATRAVLFAQLVDDPASRPEAAAFEDAEQRDAWVSAERARLFRLIEQLVTWENATNEDVLRQAKAEILRSANGAPPPVLDPFAGGGAIPLEAQRLGLQAHASDLNPVAVLINKAMIEIPPKFAERPPIFPGAAESRLGSWPRVTGLAEDIKRYGAWMRDRAKERIGDLYPVVELADGTKTNAIAWMWARTITCPNPACSISMPLVRSWWISKKKGRETFVTPKVVGGNVTYSVSSDPRRAPAKGDQGTVGRSGAVCINCASPADLPYIRSEAKQGRMGLHLMAIVAEGKRQRVYVSPTEEHIRAAAIDKPSSVPRGTLPAQALGFRVQAYGMKEYSDLFTNRQLTALTTFSDLVIETRKKIISDALSSLAYSSNGSSIDATSYADAVTTLLGLAVSRTADLNNSLVTWSNSRDQARNLFARQAVPMAWDFVEVSPFGNAAGDVGISTQTAGEALQLLGIGNPGQVNQADAASRPAVPNAIISTDPPYYDNIGYSDLSDFFYVWLRRSLRDVHPDLLSTLLVPKAEELVANPYRHGGTDGARDFFEAGFRDVFARARLDASEDYPITVYYAFKQSEADEDLREASTGWETLLDGMVRGGWQITGTWPMRSERGGRMVSVGTNALASCIVLALRPRAADSPVVDRRRFASELRGELPEKLRELQQGSIAPVDLPQAAIGPGMAILSRYAKVVEADGEAMSVRSALQVINQVLGEVLSAQEGDFDAGTRWCVKWFESYGFDPGTYGEAETLASAFNTSVAGLDRSGVLSSRGGKVQLFDPAGLGAGYDPRADDHITLWEVVVHLAKALDEQGLDAAGLLMARAAARIDLDAAKELAYLLFSIAERKRWSGVAQLFNMLAASWADVLDAARRKADSTGEQLMLDTAY